MKKKLRNFGESLIERELRPALDEYGAQLFEKVRVADVVDIKALSSRPQGTYALQSHFDFVVADANAMPQFAIEFDGSGHDPTKDSAKDGICSDADLALFRIATLHRLTDITRMSLVKFLVDLWFMAHEFKRQQDEGAISQEEPFMLSGFLKPNARHIFDSEWNFHGHGIRRIREASKALGATEEDLIIPRRQFTRLRGPNDQIVAYESLLIGSRQIVGKFEMSLRIPCYGSLAEIPMIRWEIGEFAMGLAIEDLLENMRLLASGAGHVVPTVHDYIEEIEALTLNGYRYAGGGSVSNGGLSLTPRDR